MLVKGEVQVLRMLLPLYFAGDVVEVLRPIKIILRFAILTSARIINVEVEQER